MTGRVVESAACRGLFVAVDGPKSVGKTTLINKLRARSADTGSWIFTKEPTDGFDLGNEQSHTGYELAALIAADRARHVAEVIDPARRNGLVVLSDRYVLSSFVFHCLDGVAPGLVNDLNVCCPRPDVLLVLQCSPGTLEKRRAQRERQTRLATTIKPEDEILGYLTFADRCRPVSNSVTIGYHETVADTESIADLLIAEIAARRSSHG